MSKMRKLLESLDDIIDGEPVGAEKPSMAKPKSSTKFLGKPYKRGEDDQEVTETDDEEDGDEKDLKESLKAQFEDYVKNKAVPDSKKELKLEKQEDGSYQVTNEKGSVVCRGAKSDCQTHITKKNTELNDAKLDEAAPVMGKAEKMARLKAILDKVSGELKNTRKQMGSGKKVTEAPIDQQVPPAAGNTVQAAPGVVQAAGQAQQAPANQQGAIPANQAQQQPKPAPGQPQAPQQQAPAQPGQQTAAPAPGQQKPPATGQAGGAPVAQPPGTPAPAQGSAVNAATTPGEQVKGLVQTLASNPGAAKQLGTKLSTVIK